jgi:hypothetical protein
VSAERLTGVVERVSLRQLRSGQLKHDTRIRFTDPASPYKSLRVTGYLPVPDWEETLLTALQERYDVDELPEPKWTHQ